METLKEIIVVKFDCGFYADKQPNLGYSFTENVIEARRFDSQYAATVILKCGLELGQTLSKYPLSGEIETYEIHSRITKK